MLFEIVGEISDIENIATGRGVRRRKFLRKRYGGRLWRKQKGIARVRLSSSSIRQAEIHWYEAHGVGRVGWKIKRFLD
jgi:nucleotidyltransferase/DNA polymerase involved in DNA repair